MEGKTFDAVAIGEILVDCLVEEQKDALQIKANPGGAPANVAAGLARLGVRAAFIGKAGNDVLGRFLERSVREAGVDTSGMILCEKPTTMALVSLDGEGNRSFSFVREHTADVELQPEELSAALLQGCRLLHFGTVSMTAEPSRSATKRAVEAARENGARISFDPNLRPGLWAREQDMLEAMEWGFGVSDYVKLSEEEQTFFTGIRDPEAGGRALMERFGFRLLAVTRGPKGLALFHRGLVCSRPAYDVKTVDTTGAGDAMWAATLYRLLQGGDAPEMDLAALRDLAAWANAAGSCCTTRFGAIPAMPTREEIRACMEEAAELPVREEKR